MKGSEFRVSGAECAVSGVECRVPLSSELGTYTTVKARFWP